MAASTNTTRIAETPVKNVLTLPQKSSPNIFHLDITLRSRRIWIVKTGLVEVGDDEEKK